jgi:ankyrin repeat protein
VCDIIKIKGDILATWNDLEDLIINKNYKQLQEELKDPEEKFFPYGAYEFSLVILENKGKINKKKENGETALMIAAAIRNFKMTQYLLQQGAEVSARHNYGESAFDIAMKYHHKGNSDLEWFQLFESYKDQFDEKDLIRYHETRLSVLFS